MGILDTLTSWLGKLNQTNLQIAPERCCLVRNRNATCTKCADACTGGAIVFEGGIQVREENCIKCGTCATVCPTDAIEATQPTDYELVQSVIEQLETKPDFDFVITCQPMSQTITAKTNGWANAAKTSGVTNATKTVKGADGGLTGVADFSRIMELPCLGRLSESALTALLSLGLKQLQLLLGDCANCENKTGRTTIDLVQANLASLFRAWNIPNKITLITELPSEYLISDANITKQKATEGKAEARRGFFSSIKETGSKAVKDAAIKVAPKAILGSDKDADVGSDCDNDSDTATIITGDDATKSTTINPKYVREHGHLPQYSAQRHKIIINSLNSLSTSHPSNTDYTTTVKTSLWANLNIDKAKCNTCLLCATFCPTGALAKSGNTLTHTPVSCVQCGLCADSCFKSAITVEDKVKVNDLMSGATYTLIEQNSDATLNGDDGNYMVSTMQKLIGPDTVVRAR